MTSIIDTFMVCGTLLALAFMVLLSLPKSQLRSVLLETLGWLGTILAGIYILCPIDLIPDFIPIAGWLDDGGALIGGIVSLIAALGARSDRQKSISEQPRQEVPQALSYSEDTSEEQYR